ncbi:MAG: DNA translocase FtsK, partial [Paludibacteraceae bacterium]|nr:DNA translocase FtsK [Paludibacteraceae bacterium]
WGVILLLFVSIVVIMIFASSKTLPFIKKLFTFKKKSQTVEAESQKAIGTEMVPEEWVEPSNVSSPIELDLTQTSTPEEFLPTQPTENEVEEEEKENNSSDLEIDIVAPEDVEVGTLDYILKTQGKYDPTLDLSHYKFPSLSLLKTYPNENAPIVNMDEQNANKERIVNALGDFGIEITSIKATIGPTVTLYEIVPKAGTRISKIRNLESDIMLSIAAIGIRIIAPIPGKGTIGIEVPNKNPQIVSMHSIIASKKFQEEEKMALPVAIGRTITNEVFMFDLAKTPHLLVAGATGQGKSVGLNAVITSLLYKKHPAELKFVLIDPKRVEFNIYAVIEKHYMAKLPEEDNVIITDPTKAIQTLKSLVVEMENRYELLNKANCRNIIDYNEKFVNRQLNPEKGHRFLPYMVSVIDEFGDLIMVAGKEIETPIARITQMGRAAGIHMILATQRPSVNIITGVIKSNVPTRIAFRVSSTIDSRTILDASGANQLVGKGDLLYSGGNDITRVQCAFVDTPEVEDIVDHISKQQAYPSAYELPEPPEGGEVEASGIASADIGKRDDLFVDVARWVVTQQIGSTSAIQRTFELGFPRAGKIMTQLEKAGIVGPQKGSKPRQVLVQDEFTLNQILDGLK